MQRGPRAKVTVIQHIAPEGPGAIRNALRSRGVAVEVVRVDRGEPVPPALDAAGLVVMGGPMGVAGADRNPHLRSEIELIRSVLAAGRPVLGICLGSQLLAAALGARVYRAAAKEIGWYDVTLLPAASDDALFRGLDTPFPALHWHGDVFDLPEGSVPLAASARTPLQAFRAARTAYGLLFHLELDRQALEGMCEAFAHELNAEQIAAATLLRDADRILPRSRRVGAIVFQRWAGLLVANEGEQQMGEG